MPSFQGVSGSQPAPPQTSSQPAFRTGPGPGNAKPSPWDAGDQAKLKSRAARFQVKPVPSGRPGSGMQGRLGTGEDDDSGVEGAENLGWMPWRESSLLVAKELLLGCMHLLQIL